MSKEVVMRVPEEFRSLIRKQAGEEDTSMFKYLKKISRKKVVGGGFDFKW